MPSFYQLQLTAYGTTNSAYYFVNLFSGVAYDSAAITIYPTKTNATYFSFNSSSMQFQSPPATSISAGSTIITDATNIAGTLGISPALSVNATLTLYGAGGTLGTITLQAGQTRVQFNFDVNPSQAMSAEEAQAAAARLAPKPEPEA